VLLQAHPVYWQHKLPIRKICFWERGLVDTLLSSAEPSRHHVRPNWARVTILVNPIHRPLIVNFIQDALLQHIELDRKLPNHSWPLRCQATRTVPGNVSTPICRVLRSTPISYLLQDLYTYPAHKPRDQQGRPPRLGPTHPTNRGPQTPSEGKPVP